MLFVDIFDTPFVILALVMTITIWRAFHLWKLFRELSTRNQRRKLIAKQFCFWMLDIPAALCSFIVFCSIYRAKRMYFKLKEVIFQKNFKVEFFKLFL